MFIPDGIFDTDGSIIKSLMSSTYITIKRQSSDMYTTTVHAGWKENIPISIVSLHKCK